ncbi:hypothetical protein MACH17_11430 [Phaeobacter inhibens]|nr:hypothetical protein MACH17_11430 [Phaeobacter inhibens]
MARDDLHFRLRIPEGLKLRVEKAAKYNRRSMTAEIVATLEEKYPEPIGLFENQAFLDELAARIEKCTSEAGRVQMAEKATEEYQQLYGGQNTTIRYDTKSKQLHIHISTLISPAS